MKSWVTRPRVESGLNIIVNNTEASAEDIRKKSIELLARREHAPAELRIKLQRRGFDSSMIESTLDRLIDEDLLSEDRYVECYVATHIARGRGPSRLRSELRQRGIGDELIACYLSQSQGFWHERVRMVRDKKFGCAPPIDYKTRAKQARFLQSRGFTTDQINWVLNQDGDD